MDLSKDQTEPYDFQSLSAEYTLKKLSVSSEGLSEEEASKRLKEYGYNEITEKKLNPLLKFLTYFWGPIPWMIEIAAILSAIVHHWADFGIIVIMLVINAVVGFWQEYKADNAIEQLKKKLALNARVLRDGQWQVIPARELVPGDVIRIRLGDIIPADVKLLKGDYALIDESALTGESLPVEKHAENQVYGGSIVKQGEMDAMVTGTGMKSYFGRTAKLVAEATTKSHLQKAVIKIADYLIVITIALIVVLLGVALFRHENFIETVQFMLILTVASIPVALPAVLSVTMAIGAGNLAKKKTIVSRLEAVEELAGMDTLCSDKTGTLTKNELTLAPPISFGSYQSKDVILFAALASQRENQDPIDLAILKGTADFSPEEIIKRFQIQSFTPFDPVSKRTEAMVKDDQGKVFKVSKGAPQVILALLENREVVSPEINQEVERLAAKGYRTLGVASTDETGTWRFVGLIPLFDPPRDDSAATVETAREMGIEVKMVTGDHVAIAKTIAGQLGLKTNITPASSILAQKDHRATIKIIEEADGFAQVFPEHKYTIVEALQDGEHIVGMTGDGVNDAPALKKADCGIAVSGATDAARSAADIVLTLPGLSVIIDAIKESRKIFQRMNNYAIYRITETIRVLIFMSLSILVFNFYPVTAIMIVLLALLNDLPIMTIAYDNVKYSNQPEQWNLNTLLGVATALGLAGVASTFGILYIGDEIIHLSREALQSFIYLKLSVAGHMTLFVARTKGPFWSTKPAKPLFLAIISTQLIATLIVVYGIILPPIGWKLALFVWGYALAWFAVNDLVKLGAYRTFEHGLLGKRHLERVGHVIGG
ncbi:MAG: metal ABC transporter ATPase [Deltaproteobacteria bacterium DG_8]|nr:MAG: metal ABC transporter ATPase [Deltaproteobacteria bacterium DG_8]